MDGKEDETGAAPQKLSPKPALLAYIAGGGLGPFSSTGSWYGWIQPETGKKLVKHQDGLNTNMAECLALVSAARNLQVGRVAEILSSSQLVVRQFNRESSVHDPALRRLLRRARRLTEELELKVRVTWVSREKNPASKLVNQ
jgi:ribonuclease HI